ncbi:hypothetical protein ACWD5R_32040 [Streptomyces sp. NPDC002514]|uniref:hypothetical protein n=1 Tax=Streptomyces sp. NPDC001270 TaxID=3364554 RepID=UPI0036C07B1D
MARGGCGGEKCNCSVIAGENVTISGSGSTANPYTVNAMVPCETVRGCFSAGPGIDLDPATGIIAADLSEQAGNNLTINQDGGLYVPTAGGTVLTGCGLSGDGSASAPVTAATGAWPYPCEPDSVGGVVVCDSDGILRGEPRGAVTFATSSDERTYPDVRIGSGSVAPVDTFTLTVTNPSTCRPALVIAEQEVDIFVVLPAGAGAATGFDGDEMWYMRNTGSSSMVGVHSQGTKVLSRGTVEPGASMAIQFSAAAGRGSDGAYYYRINALLRALLIAM